ncbi:MAG: EF-P lysine aminoacylase EpmA [bacterium]
MSMIQPDMHSFRHRLLRAIRDFFDEREYLEVTTPILVRCPGIDPYIDAIPAGENFYLATSPELHMKRLLGCGLKKIYQITHAFRAEETGRHHNCEFSILEWYETGIDYQTLMELTESFIQTIDQKMCRYLDRDALFHSPFPRISVDDAFLQYADWQPSKEWNEERFFIDLIEIVEPALKNIPAFFLYDFPAPLASLARLKPEDPDLCERFELYLKGVEIANGFSELTCVKEQKERFERDRAKRAAMNKEPYPLDSQFLLTLEKGLLPDCAGIAAGIDRILMVLTESSDISEVMAFPSSRL